MDKPISSFHGGGLVIDGILKTSDLNGWKEASFKMTKEEINRTIELLQELLRKNE